MKRTPINPSRWGATYSMNQGEVVEGVDRLLHISGQASIVDDPTSPTGDAARHSGDMRAQIELSLANIDAILSASGMARDDILHVRFYATDMASFNEHYDVHKSWIDEAGIQPPQTVLGISCLALPELMVEIEVTAGVSNLTTP